MADSKDNMPIDARRRRLLAEGALYRLSIIDARTQLHANLTAPALAKTAMHRMVGALSSSIGGIFSGKAGNTLQSVAPLFMSVLSLLPKQRLRKPLLYCGALGVGVGVALAGYLLRQRRARSEQEGEPVVEE